MKQSVQYLIDREMKIFAPRDYISEIPNLLSENELNEIVKRIEQVITTLMLILLAQLLTFSQSSLL